MARKSNPALANIARFKANIAARDKNRLAVRPQAGPDPFANIGELGAGALRVGKNVADYAVRSSPQKVGSDIVNTARNVYRAVKADPIKFGFESLAGTPTAMADFAQARNDANNLRASGNAAAAKKLEEQAASMLLMAIPVVGAVGKAAGKVEKAAAKGARLAVKGAEDVAPLAVKKEPFVVPPQGRAYTPEEQAVYNAFGSKFKGEAARAKQVGQATEGDATNTAAKKQKMTAAARKFRDMQATQGEAAVIKAVKAGEHLKPTDTGYVGAPRTVTNPQKLGAMRVGLDKQFNEAAKAVDLAVPGQVGTWYSRAKAGMAESNEPYQLGRNLEQHGVYSAGVAPEAELGFALKHLNSRILGEPKMAYRGAGENALDSAVAENRAAILGDKTGEYMLKQDPRVPVSGKFGVNDFRAAQTFGYTSPRGEPWKAAVSNTMHPFMDAETALMTERANAANAFGRSDWTGPHLQEVPWIYGKAQDLYSRGAGPTARFGGEPIEGMKAALIEANKTPADFYPKHTLTGTYEYAPGVAGGHVPSFADMTPEERVAYGMRGHWAQPSPETATIDLPRRGQDAPMPSEVGAGDRDVLYGAAGFRQLPTIEMPGLYKNSLGEYESNPAYGARPLVDFPTGGGGGRVDPLTMQSVSAIERLRGLIDAQEASAANLVHTGASLSGKNAALLDTGGRQLTSDQLRQASDVLGDMGDKYGITATNRGAAIFPFDPSSASSKDLANFIKAKGAALQDIVPASELRKGIASTAYVPAFGKFDDNYNIVPTEPYTGEATHAVLQDFANLPSEVSRNIGESENVRSVIREKYLRDAALGGARGDLQNTRRFFSEADWPKAVELMKKGLSATAALAALGYASSSLAETPEQ